MKWQMTQAARKRIEDAVKAAVRDDDGPGPNNQQCWEIVVKAVRTEGFHRPEAEAIGIVREWIRGDRTRSTDPVVYPYVFRMVAASVFEFFTRQTFEYEEAHRRVKSAFKTMGIFKDGE